MGGKKTATFKREPRNSGAKLVCSIFLEKNWDVELQVLKAK